MANLPTGEAVYRALNDVRAMVHRLGSPFWMTDPTHWRWRRPDGQAQGFGLCAYDCPGLANLQWLALDLQRPPAEYDAKRNPLYLALVMYAEGSKLAGAPLIDMASTMPLRMFVRLLPEPGAPFAPMTPLEAMYPALRLLALKRIYALP